MSQIKSIAGFPRKAIIADKINMTISSKYLKTLLMISFAMKKNETTHKTGINIKICVDIFNQPIKQSTETTIRHNNPETAISRHPIMVRRGLYMLVCLVICKAAITAITEKTRDT